MDLSKHDLMGLDWISAKNFVEVKSVNGINCLIFRDKIPGDRGETVYAQATIDANSRLPLYLQVGESVTTFRYGHAPDRELVLPAELVKLTEQKRRQAQQARLVPPS